MRTTTEDIELQLADAPGIDGLRFRRPRSDDADDEAMAAVITAANLRDGIEEIRLARHVREELESSVGVDPTADIMLTEIDGRVVAGSGVERTVRDDVVVYDLWEGWASRSTSAGSPIGARSRPDRRPGDVPWHHLRGRRWRIRSCVPT